MLTSNLASIGIILLFLAFSNGNSTCDFEPCLDTYNSLKALFDTYNHHSNPSRIPSGVMQAICSQQHELKNCTRKQSKTCRGDLNYHFFVRLVQRIQTNNSKIGENCSEIINSSPNTNNSEVRQYLSSNIHSGFREHQNGRNYAARCTPKPISEDEPSVGCALYGLTNLKSFSDTLNFTDVPYCSLSGAWSLVDMDAVGVQITNKGGLSPLPKDITTTTLVTVIVKNNECTERKTYQATFDEVPAMFLDGSTRAGTVYIEEVKRSEHVRIHFPYAAIVVEIIRVLGHLPISTLSVTIRMPQSNATNISTNLNRGRGVPLCFYGCPKTANIKPRSIDPSHRCPSSTEDGPSAEFMNTANSITSAVCDSLANVHSILDGTSKLDQHLKFSGEETFVTTQNDGSHILSDHQKNPRVAAAASAAAQNFASALRSQSLGLNSVGTLYLSFLTMFQILLPIR